jgi:hypothetical protein
MCKRYDAHKDVVGKKCSTGAAEGSELWCGYVSRNSINQVEQKVVEWTGECSATNQCSAPLAKRGLVCGLAGAADLVNAPKPVLKIGNDKNGADSESEPNNPKPKAGEQSAGMPATTDDSTGVPAAADVSIRDK